MPSNHQMPNNYSLDSLIHLFRQEYNISPDKLQLAFLAAIGAPISFTYRFIKDELDFKAGKQLYVNRGIDFELEAALYRFTPSFIEWLEQQVAVRDDLRYLRTIYQFESQEPEKIRRERVRRMNCPKGQLIYLLVIRDLLESDHPAYLKQCNTEEKLHFMATAYNLNLVGSTREILVRANEPYGYDFEQLGVEDPVSFGDLAVKIYRKLITR